MSWENIIGLLVAVLTFFASIGVAWFGFRGKKAETEETSKQTEESAIGSRWDDASELATKMRAYIQEEVEKQVAPIRQRLAEVEAESHELAVAVRSREVQLWMWDVQGRPGEMPQLPIAIYEKLGINYIFTDPDEGFEKTIGGDNS